jgi:hypothetical protein
VDVNNASVTALLKLPGVDGDIATEICECREKLGGFATLEDLGATLDLSARRRRRRGGAHPPDALHGNDGEVLGKPL